jgi:lipoate-protein ligase B
MWQLHWAWVALAPAMGWLRPTPRTDPYLKQNAAGFMDRRTEMVQLATQLLSEQIQPVRILSISDEGGEPQGEFVSNQQRFVFKFTRGGEVTYRPKGQSVPSSNADSAAKRIDHMKSMLRAAS